MERKAPLAVEILVEAREVLEALRLHINSSPPMVTLRGNSYGHVGWSQTVTVPSSVVSLNCGDDFLYLGKHALERRGLGPFPMAGARPGHPWTRGPSPREGLICEAICERPH
jgi:hypothetical protein